LGSLPDKIGTGGAVELPGDEILSLPETKEPACQRILKNKENTLLGFLPANDQIGSELRLRG
jgi:hypothetical protein